MIYTYVGFGVPGLVMNAVSTLHKNHVLGTAIKHGPGLIHGYFKEAGKAKNDIIDEQYANALKKNPGLTRKEFIKTLPADKLDKIKNKASIDGANNLLKSDKIPGLLDDIKQKGYNQSKKEIRGLSRENERLKKQIAKLQARG